MEMYFQSGHTRTVALGLNGQDEKGGGPHVARRADSEVASYDSSVLQDVVLAGGEDGGVNGERGGVFAYKRGTAILPWWCW